MTDIIYHLYLSVHKYIMKWYGISNKTISTEPRNICPRKRDFTDSIFYIHCQQVNSKEDKANGFPVKGSWFPGGPVVKTVLPMQRTWVPSLVGKLRSHMLHGLTEKNKKNPISSLVVAAWECPKNIIHPHIWIPLTLSHFQ